MTLSRLFTFPYVSSHPPFSSSPFLALPPLPCFSPPLTSSFSSYLLSSHFYYPPSSLSLSLALYASQAHKCSRFVLLALSPPSFSPSTSPIRSSLPLTPPLPLLSSCSPLHRSVSRRGESLSARAACFAPSPLPLKRIAVTPLPPPHPSLPAPADSSPQTSPRSSMEALLFFVVGHVAALCEVRCLSSRVV